MNPIMKLINMFRKTPELKYANCLTHRPWLARQVDEVMRKRKTSLYTKAEATTVKKDDNWYTRYL